MKDADETQSTGELASLEPRPLDVKLAVHRRKYAHLEAWKRGLVPGLDSQLGDTSKDKDGGALGMAI